MRPPLARASIAEAREICYNSAEVIVMNNIRTGALIRRLRLEHGLTQRALAERLCVGDKTVSKWERGE